MFDDCILQAKLKYIDDYSMDELLDYKNEVEESNLSPKKMMLILDAIDEKIKGV